MTDNEILTSLLREVLTADQDYPRRYRLILHIMSMAILSGYEVGMRIDPDEPEWPVVVIELPTGQVSWHMPQHPKPWDGHTTEEKFERIQQFLLLSQE